MAPNTQTQEDKPVISYIIVMGHHLLIIYLKNAKLMATDMLNIQKGNKEKEEQWNVLEIEPESFICYSRHYTTIMFTKMDAWPTWRKKLESFEIG